MRFLRRFFIRLSNFATGRADQRLQDELAEHLAFQIDENLRAGMSPAEARRQAALKLGAAAAIRENHHAEQSLPFFENLSQDLRYAVRMMVRSPGLFNCDHHDGAAGATRAFRDPNQNQDVKGGCQMNKKKAGVAFITLLTCALAGQALAQGPEFNSNADDLTKIRSVVEEFRQDIIHKDGYALTKLMLNPNVLFHAIDDQKEVDGARKINAQFDGIGPSALDGTATFLATSKDKLEEKFHNVEIRQDGDLGLVTFNYDFVVNDKVTNSGLEHWQVRKIDGQWKILSVTWTSYSHS